MTRMTPEHEAALADVLRNFEAEARNKMESALLSGALPDDFPPVVVAKFAVIVTADGYEPSYKPHKAALKNLRCFV